MEFYFILWLIGFAILFSLSLFLELKAYRLANHLNYYSLGKNTSFGYNAIEEWRKVNFIDFSSISDFYSLFNPRSWITPTSKLIPDDAIGRGFFEFLKEREQSSKNLRLKRKNEEKTRRKMLADRVKGKENAQKDI